MTTIMTSDCGRCNAKCYNAKGDRCTCICDGLNHGTGYKQAIENMVKMLEVFALPEDMEVADLQLAFTEVE